MSNTQAVTASWWEPRQMWRCAVQRDGERKYFYSKTPGRRGKKECENKAEAWLDLGIGAENPFVRQVYSDWLEDVRTTSSENQRRAHASFGNLYILPAIGSIRMDRLRSEQQLQDIINNAFINPANGGDQLSRKSLMNLRATITAFLKYCRKRNLTRLHPENLVIPRTAAAGERTILQPSDLRVLFSERFTSPRYGRDREEWFIHAFRFQVLTGLRPGETLGLKWSDIHEGVLSVRRSWTSRGEWTAGKNENARRSFVLPDQAVVELDEQRQMTSDADVQSELVFPWTNGEPAEHRTYRKHLLAYCAHNHITSVSPYELRHTWFSLNKTLPPELVKIIGGHSDSMDTFGTYGHDVDGDRERAAELLNEVFSKLLADS